MSTPTLFEVPVTTAATVTAFLVVAANNEDEAGQKALGHVRSHGSCCVLDDDSIHWNEAYLPDPDAIEAVDKPALKRSADEFPLGIVVVVASDTANQQAIFLHGRLIHSVDADRGGSIEALTEMARSMANALETSYQTITLIQEGDNWEWSDVARQLRDDAPTTERQLCEEFVRFCTSESLPHQSAEELLLLSLTDIQKAWLIRFVARWEAVVGS